MLKINERNKSNAQQSSTSTYNDQKSHNGRSKRSKNMELEKYIYINKKSTRFLFSHSEEDTWFFFEFFLGCDKIKANNINKKMKYKGKRRRKKVARRKYNQTSFSKKMMNNY